MQPVADIEPVALADAAPPAGAEKAGALLSAGDLRIALRPADGGRIGAFWIEGRRRRDILVPMTGPVADPLFWPKAGCYPLAPFSNRIRNACFPFAGETVRLDPHPACAPHALHGFSQTRPWELTIRGDAGAVMRYRHRPDRWPWAFVAEQRLNLDPARLTVTVAIRNLDERPMPLGFGLHPYFAASPGDRIAFDVAGEWTQDEAGCGVALNPLAGSGGRFDRAHGVNAETRYFAGWSGVARLERADGVTIGIEAPSLDHFVFHVPAGGAYACMEPVSHVADAFNLAAAGREGTGFRTLDPGDEATAAIRIEVAAA